MHTDELCTQRSTCRLLCVLYSQSALPGASWPGALAHASLPLWPPQAPLTPPSSSATLAAAAAAAAAAASAASSALTVFVAASVAARFLLAVL
jgi:hypothetical protein